ncbi:alpha/beta hydrolase [Candidatus Roizmanbacteria bacterium]|nr:alpha/beta hydrolase [Candidatus Roizmanbacteria bacterium]
MKLKLNRKTINYEIKGKGDPFLLVHGWGGNSSSLENLSKLLSSQYKTITLDLPGFGLSSKPDPDWGVEEYAKFLINIIDKLKLKPVVYFGHSFGGALGFYVAANYPTYIKKLIISGGSYKREKPTSTVLSRLFKWFPTFIKIIIYKVIYPQSDRYKLPTLEANFRKIMTLDLTPIIHQIKTPTLILWGEDDIQTSVELAKEAHQKIKNSQIKIFPEIGHNLPLKYPQLVYGEMEKFL